MLGIKCPPHDCPFGSKHNTSVRPFSPWWDKFATFAGKFSQKASKEVVFGGQAPWDIFPEDDARLHSLFDSGVVDFISDLTKS
jgi:hypothetical protein